MYDEVGATRDVIKSRHILLGFVAFFLAAGGSIAAHSISLNLRRAREVEALKDAGGTPAMIACQAANSLDKEELRCDRIINP